MLSGPCRGEHLIAVQVHRGGDIDRFHLGIGKKVLRVPIPLAGAVFTRESLGQFRPRPAHRHELPSRKVPQRRGDPFTGNVAAPDQAPFQFPHILAPFETTHSQSGDIIQLL